MMEVLLPVRTWSEPNLRGHWAKRARRVRQQRLAARTMVGTHLRTLPADDPLRAAAPKLAVRLTRIAPRRLDSDNLTATLKAVRDGVADALGLDDGDESSGGSTTKRRADVANTPSSWRSIPMTRHDKHKGRIYLAGPMTGYPGQDFAAFHKAAERLEAAGWDA